MRRLVAALLLVAGVCASATSASAAEWPGIGIRLLEAPSSRQDDPRARAYIIDHLSPGATITRKVEVSNGTSERVRIQVYAGAAELKNGAFQPLPASESNELTTWTRVSPAELQLAPGRAAPATVTIAVPSDASPGERYGAVWAQLSSGAPAGGGVAQVNRVGIRIYLSVGRGGEPASDFAIEAFTPRRDPQGTPVVMVQVRNTGGRALDLSGDLKLSDGPGGLSGGPFPAKLGTTLGVGETAPVTVVLDKQLPKGPWHATLTMRSGPLERSASAQITFPDAAGASAAAMKTSDSAGRGIVAAVVVGLLLLIVVAALLLWRRKRGSHS